MVFFDSEPDDFRGALQFRLETPETYRPTLSLKPKLLATFREGSKSAIFRATQLILRIAVRAVDASSFSAKLSLCAIEFAVLSLCDKE